jgi:hypothetical protein
MDLAVTDINRQDAAYPGLQQTVGESARGTAGIDGGPLVHVDVESIECLLELVSAPAHESGTIPHKLNWIRGSDLAAGLVGDRTSNEDPSRFNRVTRLGSRLHQASGNEDLVEALPGHLVSRRRNWLSERRHRSSAGQPPC